jgi:hypothetical protein
MLLRYSHPSSHFCSALSSTGAFKLFRGDRNAQVRDYFDILAGRMRIGIRSHSYPYLLLLFFLLFLLLFFFLFFAMLPGIL